MTDHGCPNESHYDEGSYVEMPLPSYDEVVGASNHHIGFKKDDRLRPVIRADSELPREIGGVSIDQDSITPTNRQSRCKTCTKKYLVGLAGVILTPLLILLILLHLKSCHTCEPLHEDKRSALMKLEKCNAERMGISKRYDELFSEMHKINRERDELLLKTTNAESDIKTLRHRYNKELSDAINMRLEMPRLEEEIENYKNLIEKLKSDLKNKDNKDSPTTTTEKPKYNNPVQSLIDKYNLPLNLNNKDLPETSTEKQKYAFETFMDSYKDILDLIDKNPPPVSTENQKYAFESFMDSYKDVLDSIDNKPPPVSTEKQQKYAFESLMDSYKDILDLIDKNSPSVSTEKSNYNDVFKSWVEISRKNNIPQK